MCYIMWYNNPIINLIQSEFRLKELILSGRFTIKSCPKFVRTLSPYNRVLFVCPWFGRKRNLVLRGLLVFSLCSLVFSLLFSPWLILGKGHKVHRKRMWFTFRKGFYYKRAVGTHRDIPYIETII